jgi:hypothetical protein
MAVLVLGIDFLQNIMKLLLDVLDPLNKFGFLISLGMSMGGLFLCNYNGQSYVSGGQWLEPQAHLKRAVANRVVEHKEDFHPMCMDVWNCTSSIY